MPFSLARSLPVLAFLLLVPATAHTETLSPDTGTTQTAASESNAATIDEDDEFGPEWPLGPGRDDTGYLCGACHSLAIVKQQGLTRSDWDELIDWMVEEQGMAELDTADRAIILDYLAEHFNVDRVLK